jgi:ubiquinone/menaquinone biosynthesis C-methylase UbiE
MTRLAATNAARSFDAWARDYDRYRPRYPQVLFDRIAAKLKLSARPRAADLGAGTGRATLAMAERGWQATAVEPGGQMLDMLRVRAAEAGLNVDMVQARAEETGLPTASFDLVTAAQAFHWFDKPLALSEMARILRPGGGVALFWNVRDGTRSALVAEYHELLHAWFGDVDTGRYAQAGRAPGRHETQAALTDAPAFGEVELEEVTHELAMTADEFVGMAFTASYVQSLEPPHQGRFRADVETLLARHQLLHGEFSIPYRIDLWTARRITP